MGLLGDVVSAFDVPRKTKRSAYASLIFLGLLGWHEFYLNKYLRGILYVLALITLIIGWIAKITLPAYIGAGVLVVFFVFDLFTLGKQVKKWNDENAGNSLLDLAGEVAGAVISAPLQNAIEEYNEVVKGFKKSIKRFNKKKDNVELLLGRLQEARKDTLAVISRVKEVITKVSTDKELIHDELGVNLSDKIINQLLSDNKKEDLSLTLEQSIDVASQQMRATFDVARELTQELESSAGKFVAATAATVISGLVEYSKQQEKIIELKQGREKILTQQREIEIKIMQLEATEKRADEILKAIEGEMPGFNHFYDEFCTVVFPDGILYQKERCTLTVEQAKIFENLLKAASIIIKTGTQEIN